MNPVEPRFSNLPRNSIDRNDWLSHAPNEPRQNWTRWRYFCCDSCQLEAPVKIEVAHQNSVMLVQWLMVNPEFTRTIYQRKNRKPEINRKLKAVFGRKTGINKITLEFSVRFFAWWLGCCLVAKIATNSGWRYLYWPVQFGASETSKTLQWARNFGEFGTRVKSWFRRLKRYQKNLKKGKCLLPCDPKIVLGGLGNSPELIWK